MSFSANRPTGARIPVIRLSRLCRSFPGTPPIRALRDVELTVWEGEHVAIIGPSGSGKSTLLNILGLLDQPTAGEYWLAGINVSALSENKRTALRGHRIGFVFQDFQLIGHRTAIENVALGSLYTGLARAERTRRAHEALTRVGLGHRVHALPQLMSGGERQRVAIARALMNAPSLLLCDEPTGNLDSTMAAQVLDVFDELNRQGTTVLVITHDPTTAARAHRSLTIRDGILTDTRGPVATSSLPAATPTSRPGAVPTAPGTPTVRPAALGTTPANTPSAPGTPTIRLTTLGTTPTAAAGTRSMYPTPYGGSRA